MTAGTIILATLEVYLAVGLLVGLGFVTLGLNRVLPHAGRVTPGARLLILPASAIFWPVVAHRWIMPR